MSFESFGFSNPILKALKKNKFTTPTNIQNLVIPQILQGGDIIAKAQTGSGKTASFVLPILEKLFHSRTTKKQKIKVLALTPTRELTLQVAQTFSIFSEFFEEKLKIVTVIGGQSLGDQLLDIQKGCDIVVATSGRLLEIIQKRQIDLRSLDFFVLDEADKMLNLGFANELDLILQEIPKKRENLLFSATYPQKVQDIVSKITQNGKNISIESENRAVETIIQRAIFAPKEKRSPLLQKLIRENRYKKVLVFMANKRASDNIAAKFRKYGFSVESFHGDLDQQERILTLEDFKNATIQILFSTDIASRGLHIDDIDCVINFDLPRSADDYIHRIGRTARAGKDGIAISFIDNESLSHFKLIQKRSNTTIQLEIIEGFELAFEEQKKQKGEEPIKGKRKSKKDKLREAETKTK